MAISYRYSYDDEIVKLSPDEIDNLIEIKTLGKEFEDLPIGSSFFLETVPEMICYKEDKPFKSILFKKFTIKNVG